MDGDARGPAESRDLATRDPASTPDDRIPVTDGAIRGGHDLADGGDETAIETSDRFARNLAETSGAMFMYSSMAGVFREADALAYKKYRDQLVLDCGAPTDPVEIMLIEQLALAHLNAGRLHFRAANAEGLDGARVYGGLAVLLQGELRRTALALKAYRSNSRSQEVVAQDERTAQFEAAEPVTGLHQKPRRRRTG